MRRLLCYTNCYIHLEGLKWIANLCTFKSGGLRSFSNWKKLHSIHCDTGDKLWPIKRNHHQLRVSSQKSALLTPSYDGLRFCCAGVQVSPPFLFITFGSSEPQNLPNVLQVHFATDFGGMENEKLLDYVSPKNFKLQLQCQHLGSCYSPILSFSCTSFHSHKRTEKKITDYYGQSIFWPLISYGILSL